jgi:hypothetical protein
MNIVIGKLVTGDFVVGKLELRDIGSYLIDVYAIIIHPDPQKPQQLRSLIIPLMAPFDDKAIKEISLDKFITTPQEAPDDIQRVYIKLTTGLDVATTSKIIQ